MTLGAICNGALVLARVGVLDGRLCTHTAHAGVRVARVRTWQLRLRRQRPHAPLNGRRGSAEADVIGEDDVVVVLGREGQAQPLGAGFPVEERSGASGTAKRVG